MKTKLDIERRLLTNIMVIFDLYKHFSRVKTYFLNLKKLIQ